MKSDQFRGFLKKRNNIRLKYNSALSISKSLASQHLLEEKKLFQQNIFK